MRRWALRAALLGWLGLGLLTPVTAWAHANLERAEPTPGAVLDQSTRELRLPLRTSLGGKPMERAKMQAVETLLSENAEPWC